MDNRDCKTCAYSSPGEGIGNGCTAWMCEYINKWEAIEAWKKLHEEEQHGNNESGKTD